MKSRYLAVIAMGVLIAPSAFAEADVIQALSQWKTLGLLGGSLACLGGVGAGAVLRGVPNSKLASFGNDIIQGSFLGLLAIGFASVIWAFIQKLAGVSIQ